MSSFTDIMQRYNDLCRFCSAFWEKTLRRYPQELACHKGCGICCELQTVSCIEACAIYHFVKNIPVCAGEKAATPGKCPFLCEDVCTIYAARPVICRTHGLALCSPADSLGPSVSCPFNFNGTGAESIEQQYVLDTGRITMNLVRLNMAFSMTAGDPGLAELRIPLKEIHDGSLNPAVTSVFERAI
jgi:uncharacterized protein